MPSLFTFQFSHCAIYFYALLFKNRNTFEKKTKKNLTLLCICVHRRTLAKFGVSVHIRRKLRTPITYLRTIYALWQSLEFLCRCAEKFPNTINAHIVKVWSFCVGTQKNSVLLSRFCVHGKVWSFCVGMHQNSTSLLRFCVYTHTMNFGVSVDVRKYSTGLNNFKGYTYVHHMQIVLLWSFRGRTQILQI